MNKEIKYYIKIGEYTIWVYYDESVRPNLYSTNKKTIKNLLFLKGFKIKLYNETEIPEDVFNLVRPYLKEY